MGIACGYVLLWACPANNHMINTLYGGYAAPVSRRFEDGVPETHQCGPFARQLGSSNTAVLAQAKREGGRQKGRAVEAGAEGTVFYS